MRRQGVRPSRVTYTAAVAGLNRPRYAGWGPKLENLARLLQDRADSGDDDASAASGGGAALEEAGERGGGGDDGTGSVGVSRRGAGGSGPSPEDFDGSIEALGDAGNADGAACLLRVMRQEGFHASPRAYRSVIYACARVGHLTEAITLAKEMETSRSEVALRSETLDVENSSFGTKTGEVGDIDAAEGADHGGGATAADVNALTPSVTMVDGGGGVEEDRTAEVGEFDLAVVYNCIVCNFARAATQQKTGGAGDGNVGGASTISSVCEHRRGGDSSAVSSRDEQRRGVGREDTKREEDGGLVALLLGAAESAEGSLGDEAAYGGVEINAAEGVPSSPVAVVGDGVALERAPEREKGPVNGLARGYN